MVAAMLFWPFANPEWSKMTQAVPLEEGSWRLPDHVPLAALLGLTSAQIVGLV